MQKTYEKRLNSFVAVVLIIVLTLADFIAIGMDFASFAIDMVATNSNNVEFQAYFKNEDGEKVNIEEANLNVDKFNMYVDISVLREGYFNGSVSLENSNMSIVNVTENLYINEIIGNTINLNQINSGNTVTLELQVKPSTGDKLNIDILNKQTTVNLAGTYVSSKGQAKIEGSTVVNAKFVSPENVKGLLDAKILSNKVYEIDGENKRVLQILVRSKLENNVYPVKTSNIEISMPKDSKDVQVIARSTNATNKNIEFRENNFTYDAENSKLQINLENMQDENGNIGFEQNAKDEFVVTCIYDENKTFKSMEEIQKLINQDESNLEILKEDIKEAQFAITQEITTYDEKVIKSSKEVNIGNTDIDGMINYELSSQEKEFYKGKIYTGEQRDYILNVRSYINSIKTNKNIKFTADETFYLSEDAEKVSKISYSKIQIKKEDFINVLGENGFITVKDGVGNIVQNITKETEADVNGIINIKLNENTLKIDIETSTPIKEGKIDFRMTKSIKESDYIQDEIKLFTGIRNKIKVNEEEMLANITLKETVTKADLEVNTTSLKEGPNENVQIKVTLLTDDESKDLYKNPKIKLTFPENAVDVQAKYKMLYGNGLEKKASILKEEDGKKVLYIDLSGEQKEYPGEAIDGTVIMVNASITMNQLMTNGKENIALSYTNEKAINYEEENKEKINENTNEAENENIVNEVNTNLASNLRIANIQTINTTQNIPNEGVLVREISAVQSQSFIVTNNIREFDIETIGKEEDKVINLKSTGETTTATVEIGAINNEGETLENVKILGRFPTKGSENTMDISLTGGIEVTSEITDVKVYYSSKEDATEDLNIAANGWTLDASLEEKRSYLIVIPEMTDGGRFKAEYGVRFPEGQSEETISKENFKVIYIKQGNEPTQVEATNVIFKQEGCLNLKMKLFGINESYIIRSKFEYRAYVTISNNSNNDIENIKVKFFPNEYWEPITEENTELDENYIAVVEKIPAGETYIVNFYAKCLGKRENTDYATIYAEAEVNSKKYTSNLVKHLVDDMSGRIRIEAKSEKGSEDNKVENGEKIEYIIDVKNTGGEDMNSLMIKDKLSKYLKLTSVTLNETQYSYNTTLDDDENTIVNIKTKLKAYESLKINVSTVVDYKSEKNIQNEEELTEEQKKTIEQIEEKIDLKSYVEGFNDYYELRGILADVFYVNKNNVTNNTNEDSEKDEEDNKNTINNEINKEDNTINNNEIKEETNTIKNQDSVEENTNKDNETKEAITYSISGSVWLDENSKGEKSGNKGIQGINVFLLKANSTMIAKDIKEKEIKAQTDNEGKYELRNIPQGEYIVAYEYDANNYMPTEYQKQRVKEENNSDAVAKEILVDGKEMKVAATDILKVDSNMKYIDLGLIEIKNFDLELTKTVSEIKVTSSKSGTKVYSVKDATLSKVEISAKEIEGAEVQVEYKIKVKNSGEVSGYAKKIVDYLPSELIFDESVNNGWYKENNSLYNDSLADEEIKPSETKEIKLILTKKMTESNTGLISNTAELAEVSNNFEVKDIDSNPGNRNNNEDDMGKADLIIGIKTGKIMSYIIIGLTMIIVVGSIMYIIKRNKRI